MLIEQNSFSIENFFCLFFFPEVYILSGGCNGVSPGEEKLAKIKKYLLRPDSIKTKWKNQTKKKQCH